MLTGTAERKKPLGRPGCIYLFIYSFSKIFSGSLFPVTRILFTCPTHRIRLSSVTSKSSSPLP
jgi:hypothetical protein